MSDAAAHAPRGRSRESKSRVTKSQKAKAESQEKARKAGRTRALKYQGPFRIR